MELYLSHGRKTPDESLEDWGPEGPRLQGVKGCHQTYGGPANIHFVDRASVVHAQRLTGWEEWDPTALTMRWSDDTVHVKGPDGVEMFYGDWGII